MLRTTFDLGVKGQWSTTDSFLTKGIQICPNVCLMCVDDNKALVFQAWPLNQRSRSIHLKVIYMAYNANPFRCKWFIFWILVVNDL